MSLRWPLKLRDCVAFTRPTRQQEERDRILAKLDIENHPDERLRLLNALHAMDKQMKERQP